MIRRGDDSRSLAAGELLGMACSFLLGFVLGAAVFMFAVGAFVGSGRP